MMSLNTPSKVTLRNANVQNEDDMRVLVNFKECLVAKFRNNKQAAIDLRTALKDELMANLVNNYVEEVLPLSSDRIHRMLVYDIAGYMMHTRSFLYSDCKECELSLIDKEENLPNEFSDDDFTRCRTKGRLIFVTIPVYQTMSVVEKIVSKHFESTSHIYLMDSFHECIAQISHEHVVPLFCNSHRDKKFGILILEYVKVRFYFESKRLKNLLLSKEKASVKSHMKLATTAHAK